MRLLVLTALVTLLLDQISKWAIVQGLDLINRGVIEVWHPYLTFRMAWNRGINFGLFAGNNDLTRWLLIAIALIVSCWVLWWISREKPGKLGHFSAGLLIGGAIGNVIDRVWYGAVADFLNMSCCGIENPFSFNVADITIFAGAVGLFLFTGGKPATQTSKSRNKTS